MSTQRFYPHRTAPEEISLDVEPDGVDIRRTREGAICVYDSDISRFSLRVSALVPATTARMVIVPTEMGNPPVELALVYRSIESRRRGTWKLEGDGTVFESVIDIDRKDWIGALQLEAVLVRTLANPALPQGFAAEKGSILSWSKPVRILFDEPASPPGGTLEIAWMDFRQVEWLEPTAGTHLFALDTSGPIPRLLLNQAIPGAYNVLNSTATHGPAARIRDATYFTIVHQVWTSLLGAALNALHSTIDPDMGSGPDLDELVEDWHRDILEDWAQFIFPGSDAEGAMERLTRSAATPDGIEDVLGRLPTVIQQRFQTHRAFEGLTRELIGS